MNRRRIVNLHAFPEGFAAVQKALVLLTILLVVLVIFQIFEMKSQGEVERMIGNRTRLRGSGFANKAVDEIGDFLEFDQFIFKHEALIFRKILFEPEEDVMDHGAI